MTSLSVLIATYNHANYLPQAIETVVQQSRPPDELLILDDASTDNTQEVIAKYAAQYPFIRHWRHAKNEGVIATSIELFERTQCDFFLPLSADDAIFPGFLELVNAVVEGFPHIGLVTGWHVAVPHDWDYRNDDQSIGEIPYWDAHGYFSPQEFLKTTLNQGNGQLAFGSASFLNRKLIRAEELCNPQFHQLHDVFARLCAGARGGSYFLDWLCRAFRVLPNSMSSATSKESWFARARDISTHLKSPEYRELFGEDYGRLYEECWEKARLLQIDEAPKHLK